MTEFMLRKNYFDFTGHFKYKIPGTAMSIKFESTHACIFKDEIEIRFLQEFQPSVWPRYIDDVFIIWTSR